MRAFRLVTAGLLLLSGAVALAQPAGAVLPPPSYTAVTGSGDPMLIDNHPFAYASGIDVPTHSTAGLEFDVAQPAPAAALKIVITAPTGGVLAVGPKTATGAQATDTAPGFEISEPPSSCWGVAGFLTIDELTTSGDGTDVIAFAAHYEYDCNGNADSVSGELRYQSEQGYAAVTQNQASWDFGTQLVKQDAWAKTFWFTNRGTGPQAVGTPSVSGSSVFKITKKTCPAALAPGASCSVMVVAHPTSTTAPATATLDLPANGLPTLTVSLRVLGSDSPDLYALAGPERVDVNWNQLAAPFDTLAGQTALYRGLTPGSLSFLRNVSGIEFVDHVAAGRNYYYAVRPRLLDGQLGDRSPVVAARPWPKYSAGMYHRLGAASRLVSAHRVSAGHPYSIKVVGTHGVPSSGVSAVALTLTAANSTATTKVYAYPAGTRRPAAADVAVRGGDTRSNFVLAQVGRGGRITIATARGSVPVTVDISGYFSAKGLATKYGMGGALHEYGWPGWIVDTKNVAHKALPAGWYVDAPVNFDPVDLPHVTSLLVEVTAYGSKGSGTITGFTTNSRPNKTSVLAYRPGVTTSSAAIIRAGAWYDNTDGNSYPSVSFLNQGKKPVQLVVTILGYFDDNTYLYGERYTPTAPTHLFGAKMTSGSNRTLSAGRAGNPWSWAFNEKLVATSPTRTTTVSLHGIGFGPAPTQGQLHAPAHVTTVSSTIGVLGTGNRIGVHDAGGTARIDVWSFGRFDEYPVPSLRNYAATGPRPAGAAPAAVTGAIRFQRLQ